ncbi:MAG: 50S ribosomal protein L18a [Candidatus Thermoplasmatota archaeon]|nr:50S ribosomal protein L18a [Candidatus Thermoplasmatota archaeon]
MKAFRIRGAFRMGRTRQSFTQEVAAETQEEAVQQVLSELGSRHRAKRRDIAVEEVVEVPREEVENSVVLYRLEGG